MSKNVIRDLLIIRDEIGKKRVFPAKEDALYSKIIDLEKKIDTFNDRFTDNSAADVIDRSTSPVRYKRKKRILELITQSQSKRLTAYELSILLSISRTRCNEYLKELEREGVVKGELEDKKMYYGLANKKFVMG